MEVRNRIVMAPMATNLGSESGYVTQRLKDYHEARARGGVGLNIVAYACVDSPTGKRLSHQLIVDDDKFIPGLAELAQVIQKHGARAALQLVHVGSSTKSSFTGVQPVAPSAIAKPGGEMPRELTVGEIRNVVSRYARAAGRAKKAGFDGVEVHAAHGYLIAHFLSGAWNRRTDAYGGDLEGRSRFLLEIVKAVRETVGPAFPFWCRINAAEIGVKGGTTIEESQKVARMLEKAGVDAINVSATSVSPMHVSPWVVNGESLPPSAHPAGFLIPLAGEIKQAVSLPVIAVGQMTPEVGDKAIQEGKMDLIAIGKGLLADPELPNKAASGRLQDIRPCIRCLNCTEEVVVNNVPLRCSVNAALGKEREYAIEPAKKAKRVVIAGGGPAGMEAARVAALRGHRVWLYEKGNSLGGQLILAAKPPYKGIIKGLSDYLQTQINGLGVKINLNTELTPALVREIKPDAVIVATGIIPAIPPIAGIKGKNVVMAQDVLSGKVKTGNRVTVIGGGVIGCETAEFLAQKGKKVTIVEMLESVATTLGVRPRKLLLDRLDTEKVTILTGAKCEKITDKGLAILDKEGKQQNIEADTIVLAVGCKPNRDLHKALEGTVPELHFAGDCVEPRRILEAIADGFRIGRTL